MEPASNAKDTSVNQEELVSKPTEFLTQNNEFIEEIGEDDINDFSRPIQLPKKKKQISTFKIVPQLKFDTTAMLLGKLSTLKAKAGIKKIVNTTSDFSLDSEESDDTYEQSSLKSEEDFFEIFGEVPNIEDISEESLTKEQSTKTTIVTDGVYEISDSASLEDVILTEEETVETLSSGESQISFEDFDAMYPEKLEEADMQSDEREFSSLFSDTDAADESTLASDHSIMTEKCVKNVEYAETFLNAIIDKVIRYCLQDESEKVLRSKLDKLSLFRDLCRKKELYYVEKKVYEFLERKVVEYYRRKRMIRFLTEDKSVQYYINFENKCKHLDCLMGLEETLTKDIKDKTEALQSKCITSENELKRQMENFENLVRKTLKRDSITEWNKLVDKKLQNIGRIRNEISETRRSLIHWQTTLADLQGKMRELEQIGNGLSVADYESLIRETNSIGKKVEERNAEQRRLNNRLHRSLHILAHSKQTVKVTGINLITQREALAYFENEKMFLENNMYRLYKVHNQLRRQLRDLMIQSGLLHKPTLLYDFDETLEKITEKRTKIIELQKSKSKLEAKIKSLQN